MWGWPNTIYKSSCRRWDAWRSFRMPLVANANCVWPGKMLFFIFLFISYKYIEFPGCLKATCWVEIDKHDWKKIWVTLNEHSLVSVKLLAVSNKNSQAFLFLRLIFAIRFALVMYVILKWIKKDIIFILKSFLEVLIMRNIGLKINCHIFLWFFLHLFFI